MTGTLATVYTGQTHQGFMEMEEEGGGQEKVGGWELFYTYRFYRYVYVYIYIYISRTLIQLSDTHTPCSELTWSSSGGGGGGSSAGGV